MDREHARPDGWKAGRERTVPCPGSSQVPGQDCAGRHVGPFTRQSVAVCFSGNRDIQ